ncbi:MAG: phospho-N-acetylmuramoyl-pentapeptide-transferase [Candidatus Hydrogenedentota bacterium]
MLYYLAEQLMPYYGGLNLFTYHTVRAACAAFTGFLLCVLFGPWIIRMLTSLKVGQYIKKEHVADLHELHKGKAGTPTMGGAIMIAATIIAVSLWGGLGNRLLWTAVLMLLALGALGFADDYLKLRRKHNDGMSARMKFAGQILVGLLLGGYLLLRPVTVGALDVAANDILDWNRLARTLQENRAAAEPTPVKAIWDRLDSQARRAVEISLRTGHFTDNNERALISGLDRVLARTDLHSEAAWDGVNLPDELTQMVAQDPESLGRRELRRRNRMLLEAALPGIMADTGSTLHTKVNIPGFKNWLVPLGAGYVVFVIILLVATTNAVNLTDGLDGLAAGVACVSLMAYTAIAYVVSRSDWSHYLYLIYVPEASELFVFGAALLGTGLGFLWFNAHPAEVFMGDTGSLALGGAIGTMAVLTKQELLLPIVAGLFVIEAGSVVLQVASFKLTGKRVFRMAPLHHHFELKGWSETKIVTRFFILAILFAMLSLSTLKLR